MSELIRVVVVDDSPSACRLMISSCRALLVCRSWARPSRVHVLSRS